MKVRKIDKARLSILFYILLLLSILSCVSIFIFSMNKEISIVLLIAIMYATIIAFLPRLTIITLRTFGSLLLVRTILPGGFPLSANKNLFIDIPFIVLLIVVGILIDEKRDRKTGLLIKDAGRPYLSGVIILAYPLIIFFIMNLMPG